MKSTDKEEKEPHEFLKLVGKNIYKHRVERGLSYEKLAAEIGLHSGHIDRMQKGYNITLMTLLKLAIAMDISPSKLLDVDYPLNRNELAGLLGAKTKKALK